MGVGPAKQGGGKRGKGYDAGREAPHKFTLCLRATSGSEGVEVSQADATLGRDADSTVSVGMRCGVGVGLRGLLDGLISGEAMEVPYSYEVNVKELRLADVTATVKVWHGMLRGRR